MDIKFLGLNLKIERVKSQSSQSCLSQDDIAHLNNESIRYICNQSEEELARRLESITIPSIELKTELARECLDKNGIVVIPDFLPRNVVNSFVEETKWIEDEVKKFKLEENPYREELNYLIQRGSAKVRDYESLAGHSKTVIEVRSGKDEGMIDVFNIDKVPSDCVTTVREYFNKSEVLGLLSNKNERAISGNLNLYINNGIENTRGFHVDSYKRKIKAFIYLTDVTCLEDGPYTYVKGSHLDTTYRRTNIRLSSNLQAKTEAPIIQLNSIVPIMANRGSLVISDQGGFHRGFPQGKEHQRLATVMNYNYQINEG